MGAGVIVQVDPASSVPVFEQLREQVARLIASGALPVGARLPTIRHLAADLGIARGTVQRVYDELAREGWVRSAGRHGTVVADARPTPDAGALDEAADRLALVALQLGVPGPDAHAALDRALGRLGPDGGRPS